MFGLLLTASFITTAQNLVLEDYSHSGNAYLNTLIAADSNSAAFQAGTRVYVLHKDGQYRYNATITSYQGKNIVFKVDPTDAGYQSSGLKPECYGVFSASNALPGNFISQQNGGRIELHNLNICNYFPGDAGGSDSLIQYVQGGLLLIGTAGGTGTIVVDSCVLHGPNGNHIRTDGPVDSVIVSNTIFGDMGNVFPSNYGAGKALDLRDRAVTYVKLQNCTFVNAQDRIVRHYTSKGPISNFIFDHNTVVNSMSYHGFLSLGKVDSTGAGTLQITNNLLIDHFALGADTAYLRQVEFSDPGEIDPLNNAPHMVWVMTNKNNAAVWNIQNNYYAITDSGAVMRSLSSPFIPRAYSGEDPFLTWNMNSLLNSQGKDTTKTFTKVNVVLASAPPLMTTMIRWVYLPRTSTMNLSGTYSNPNYNGFGVGITQPYNLILSGDGKQKNSKDANYVDSKIVGGIFALDYNRKSLQYYAYYPYEVSLGVGNVLNCSYKSSVNLQSAGIDGKIIGDPRWSWTGFIPGIIIFSATPKTLDFGTVAKNASKSDTIVVSSGGSSPLVIDSVKSSAVEFTVTPANATIGAGSNQKFAVMYHPTTPGAKTASIIFYHKAPSTKDTVSVSGDVVVAASFDATPTSFAFGKVNVGQIKKDSLTVINHGTVDLTVTSIISSKAVFTVTPATATVGVESTQKFYVMFAPTAIGVVSAKIAFNHNALTKDTILVGGEGQPASGVAGLRTGIPTVYQMHENFPNPFNPTTTILYDLPQQSMVTIRIYSILGQEIATLVDGVIAAGYHQVTWKGEHDGGTQVAGGVYFFRISAQSFTKGIGFVQTKKMLLLK